MRPVHVLAAVVSALIVGSGTFAAGRIEVPGVRTVADEGTAVTFRPTLNFAGAGVSCVDDTTRTTCTIAGGSASPLTTKGDLYTFTTVDARLAVGTDGQCLKANSATGTGLEWNTCSATSAYATVQDEGSALTQRATINFIGGSISCVDNAGASRTDCTITGGGGGISYAEASAAALAGF